MASWGRSVFKGIPHILAKHLPNHTPGGWSWGRRVKLGADSLVTCVPSCVPQMGPPFFTETLKPKHKARAAMWGSCGQKRDRTI